jgi:hypothetical protein
VAVAGGGCAADVGAEAVCAGIRPDPEEDPGGGSVPGLVPGSSASGCEGCTSSKTALEVLLII